MRALIKIDDDGDEDDGDEIDAVAEDEGGENKNDGHHNVHGSENVEEVSQYR